MDTGIYPAVLAQKTWLSSVELGVRCPSCGVMTAYTDNPHVYDGMTPFCSSGPGLKPGHVRCRNCGRALIPVELYSTAGVGDDI